MVSVAQAVFLLQCRHTVTDDTDHPPMLRLPAYHQRGWCACIQIVMVPTIS